MNAIVAAPPHTRRICVVAERIAGPLDEGGRKFAYLLVSALRAYADVRAISVGGAAESANGLLQVPPSRTFADGELSRMVRDFAPQTVCYIPEASMTMFSVIRAQMLKRSFPSARVVLLAPQPRVYSAVGRRLIRLLRPDRVLTLSQRGAEMAAALGCRASVLPPAVDLDRFRPVNSDDKAALRRKYSLNETEFLVLHVGHAKRERGIEVLADLGASARGVLVAARSEGVDRRLLQHLRARGVHIIEDYVPDVHELYQCADCYIFPVLQPDASIDAPLSVFEAMACNLPVVTSPFGALPQLFADSPGFRFAGSPGEFASAVAAREWPAEPGTREMVASYSWDNAAQAFLRAIEVDS